MRKRQKQRAKYNQKDIGREGGSGWRVKGGKERERDERSKYEKLREEEREEDGERDIGVKEKYYGENKQTKNTCKYIHVCRDTCTAHTSKNLHF